MGTSQSTPTDQTPNELSEGFLPDLFYYPPLSTPTDQTSNQPVQDYHLEDPFNYLSLNTPTNQAPNGGPEVQGFVHDLFHYPLVPTSDPNRICFSCKMPKYRQPTKEYINLGDGRYVCPYCLSVSLMEHRQLEPIIRQVYSFFDNYLKLPVKKKISVFFVDANEMAKIGIPRALGLTLFIRATINTIKRCVRRGAHVETVTETTNVKGDKAPVILLLFGYSKQILGSILAHEMTHAVIGLQGWSFELEKKVEEGICEAIGSEWLEYIAGEYNPSYTHIHAKIAEVLTMNHKRKIDEGYFGSCYAELWKTKRAIKKYGFKGTLKRVARLRNIPE